MAPLINLDAHRDQVLRLCADRTPLQEICNVLHDQHSISITVKTLRRRIDDWGFETRVAHGAIRDDALRERIRKLVCEERIPTKKILTLLAEDGITISDTTLRRIRKDLGIVLRHDDPAKLARHRERMRLRRQLEISLNGQLPAKLTSSPTSDEMAPTTPTILVLGTCDTKLSELLYTKSQIEKYVPCTVQIMDIGRSATSHELITFTQDIYTSHFTSLKRPTVEIESLDRSKYIDTLAPYACSFVADLFAENKLHAILGIGGSCGTALATQVMRDALPVGFPKLMVSTMASGDVGPYVGQTDVTMMYSVVDIAGRNRLLERVLRNAAGAIVGMAKVYFDDLVSKSTPTRPDDQPHAVSDEKTHSTDSNQSQPESQSQSDPVRIGITMFGVTTPAATTARHRLEAILPNCEIYIFHATGSGGKAMERLISEHQLDAVLDLTTTEIADHVVGGVLSAGPSRLCAATKRNIPRVLSLGACDMINFGPPESIPSAFATGSNLNLDSAPGSSSSPGSASASASASGPPPGAQQERVFHRHNPTVTLMRTTSDECVQIAKCIATNLLEGNAGWDEDCRTKVILPLGGLSLLDTPDQPFWDPKADHALFSTLEDELRGSEIAVVRDERPINDPGFATAAADLLGDLIHQSRRAREGEE